MENRRCFLLELTEDGVEILGVDIPASFQPGGILNLRDPAGNTASYNVALTTDIKGKGFDTVRGMRGWRWRLACWLLRDLVLVLVQKAEEEEDQRLLFRYSWLRLLIKIRRQEIAASRDR